MAVPFKSLDGATSVGPGADHDLETSLTTHTMQIEITGSPSRVVVALEGSHDGVNWHQLSSMDNSASSISSNTTSYAVRHIRANLQTITGGASPTVTVTIASAGG